MKYRFLIALLLPLLLCLLAGCGWREQAGLFWEERNEIFEFFDEMEPVESRGSPLPAESPAVPAAPALTTQTHIEIIESLYNNAEKTVSVAWLDDPVFVDVPGDTSHITTGVDGYEAVPRFADLSASAVCGILTAHGIASEVLYIRNTAPSGETVALRFAGTSDENGYYMNPDVPVTVYVSAQKEAASLPDPSAAGVVYLTFDDGPAEETERLIDILDTYGVKATFFTVGTALERYPETAALLRDRGHIIGCHSYSHVYEDIYADTDALSAEVDAWEAAAKSAGVQSDEVKLFRFPGGSVSSYFDEEERAEFIAMLEERGYKIFDWNSATNDAVLYLRPWGESIFTYIRDSFTDSFALSLAETDGGEGQPLIVLMHEGVEETVDLLPWLLDWLIREGYTFGNLANFPASWTFDERAG